MIVKMSSETAQQERITRLERENARLKAELDESHIRIAEMQGCGSSLKSSHN
jgi:hypothetical protein